MSSSSFEGPEEPPPLPSLVLELSDEEEDEEDEEEEIPPLLTVRIWTTYLMMGEFPSKGGVQLTFTKPPLTFSSARTFVGGCGSSMTSSRAERFSLPPIESTRHV